MEFRKENIHLIPNWFRSGWSQIGVFKNFAKLTWKHLCWSYFLTMLQVSRPETSLKRDSGIGIFLWIFCNSSKSLIHRTPPDDCFCWFLHSNQNFYLLITLCPFFPSLFSFIIDSCNYESLLRKCLKMKIFFIFYYSLFNN